MNLHEELGVKNILLIEDDPWTRDALSLFFQFEGCLLQSAASANEAIKALSGDRFDLILCEYSLSDMDGLSLLKRFGDSQPGAVKFLFTTTLTHPLVEEAGRYGIHNVIRKPFTVETLEKSLRRCFPKTRDREPVDVG
jgi:two-component system, NtrC family, response regulator GlrR